MEGEPAKVPPIWALALSECHLLDLNHCIQPPFPSIRRPDIYINAYKEGILQGRKRLNLYFTKIEFEISFYQ
jgi:hypothetical protein